MIGQPCSPRDDVLDVRDHSPEAVLAGGLSIGLGAVGMQIDADHVHAACEHGIDDGGVSQQPCSQMYAMDAEASGEREQLDDVGVIERIGAAGAAGADGQGGVAKLLDHARSTVERERRSLDPLRWGRSRG